MSGAEHSVNLKSGAISRLSNALYNIFYKLSPIFSFLICFVIFGVLFSANDIYPFGGKSVAWCDADQQFIPLLCDFKDVLDGKEGFFYSFKNAGGMNFYGVFFFNLSSPFSFLVAFYPKSQMNLCFNLMTVLKICCCALTFAVFLKRRLKRNPILITFFSLLYAFSGYTMMYYQILQWIDVVYVFPLLLLGLERMTEDKSSLLYTVSLVLCVIFQFYLSYAVVVFISLYAAVFAVTNRDKAKKFCLSFVIGSCVAALCSAVVLLPCFLQYTRSMRTSSILSTLKSSTFFPAGSTSYPTFFCLAFAVAFAAFYVVKNYKSYLSVLVLLCALPVFVEPIAKGWQTFNYMSFPTRYGFITITLVLYVAAMQIDLLLNKSSGTRSSAATLSKSGKIVAGNGVDKYAKTGLGILVGLFCCVFALFTYEYFKDNSEKLTVYVHSLWGNGDSFKALLIYAAFPFAAGVVSLCLLCRKLLPQIAVYALIAALCVIECAFSCNVYMISAANDSVKLKRAVSLENLIEDDEFYRLKVSAKFYDVNLTGAVGYNSLAHYTSLNDRLYMHTAKQLGFSSYWMEVNSNGGTVFTDALVRNKYVVSTGASPAAVYSTLAEDGTKFSVLQNEYVFPFGFFIEDGENYAADEGSERWLIQEKLYEKLTGDSGLYKKYAPSGFENVVDLSTAERFAYEAQASAENSRISYSVKIDSPVSLYFDLFDEYTNRLREPYYGKISSIKVKVNGHTRRTVSAYPSQSNNGALYLGDYSGGTAEVIVTLTESVSANSFGVFSIDKNKLKNAVNGVIGGHFNIEPNAIAGSIEAKESGYVFFCVPYNAGFSAVVNGKKAEINEFNGFMTVKAEAGNNSVRLTFKPEGFTVGAILSALGVAVGAAYFICLFANKLRNEKIASAAEKISFWGVLCLGAAVFAVIYMFPPIVNLLF